jgi:hypothetical protein
MKNLSIYVGVLVVGVVLGLAISSGLGSKEMFIDITESNCEICGDESKSCGCKKPRCESCNKSAESCGCGRNSNKCPQIDWSKYVLKASVPPCPRQPDMSRYMLKTECPAAPDMSRYILKSAVPACPPCISTCNKPCKIGACPPCPPPQRCPVVVCPEPKSCPPCAPVEPPRCPEPKVSCKANYEPEDPWMVRPLMASITGM